MNGQPAVRSQKVVKLVLSLLRITRDCYTQDANQQELAEHIMQSVLGSGQVDPDLVDRLRSSKSTGNNQQRNTYTGNFDSTQPGTQNNPEEPPSYYV